MATVLWEMSCFAVTLCLGLVLVGAQAHACPMPDAGLRHFFRVRTRSAAGLSGHRDTLAFYPDMATDPTSASSILQQ